MGKSRTNLALKYPKLAQEWHPTLNGCTTPESVAPSGRFRAWWKCPKCRNSYDAIVNNRAQGKGCPYCGSNRVDPKRNFATEHPSLVSQWHPTKNTKASSEYMPGSRAKVWWLCDEGHSWEAQIANRIRGAGCPHCSKHSSIPVKFRSLALHRPELIFEWDYERNKIPPTEVSYRVNKRAWWRCEAGHSWEASIANRSKGHGCPYCSGNLVTSENNLTVTHPLVSQQWHPTKNKGLSPQNFSYGSGYKIWWLCSNGHEWEAFINNRTNKDSGCPHCLKSGSSRQELLIWSELSHVYGNDNVSHRCRKYGFELDVFIKPIKIGVEYDGYYWHRSEKKRLFDTRKYLKAKEKGVRLIRISTVEDAPPADHLIQDQKVTKDVMNEIIKYLKIYDLNDYLDLYLKSPDLLSTRLGLR